MSDRAGPARARRLLLVTRSYPQDDDLYKYPFLHRRVLAYRDAGIETDVFRVKKTPGLVVHEFEGVTCHTGSPDDIDALVRGRRYDAIAAHGAAETMWRAICRVESDARIYSWLHGTEAYAFARREYAFPDPLAREKARAQFERNLVFWRALLSDMPARLTMVAD